jgi:hypothetical protein
MWLIAALIDMLYRVAPDIRAFEELGPRVALHHRKRTTASIFLPRLSELNIRPIAMDELSLDAQNGLSDDAVLS